MTFKIAPLTIFADNFADLFGSRGEEQGVITVFAAKFGDRAGGGAEEAGFVGRDFRFGIWDLGFGGRQFLVPRLLSPVL